MENYFIIKRFINIIKENINNDFLNALRSSYQDKKYDNKNKEIINYIINKLQELLNQHINDITFGVNISHKHAYINFVSDIKVIIHNNLLDNEFNRMFINDILSYEDNNDKSNRLNRMNSLC